MNVSQPLSRHLKQHNIDCLNSLLALALEHTKVLLRKTHVITHLMAKVEFWRMHSRLAMDDYILTRLRLSPTSPTRASTCCTLLFMRLDIILVLGIPAWRMQSCTRLTWDTNRIWSYIATTLLEFIIFMVSCLHFNQTYILIQRLLSHNDYFIHAISRFQGIWCQLPTFQYCPERTNLIVYCKPSTNCQQFYYGIWKRYLMT